MRGARGRRADAWLLLGPPPIGCCPAYRGRQQITAQLFCAGVACPHMPPQLPVSLRSHYQRPPPPTTPRLSRFPPTCRGLEQTPRKVYLSPTNRVVNLQRLSWSAVCSCNN